MEPAACDACDLSAVTAARALRRCSAAQLQFLFALALAWLSVIS